MNGETPTQKAPGTCDGQAGTLPVRDGGQAWMKFRSSVDTAHISTADPELRAELETSNTYLPVRNKSKGNCSLTSDNTTKAQ